jgi:hypothetical protein
MLEDAMSIEAMKQALEVLTDKGQLHPDDYKEKKNEAITALRTAIAEVEKQEPVHQWQQKHSPYWYDGYPDNTDGGGPYETRTLYTTPPAAQRPWVGLTDEEISELWAVSRAALPRYATYASLVGAKLRSKNT